MSDEETPDNGYNYTNKHREAEGMLEMEESPDALRAKKRKEIRKHLRDMLSGSTISGISQAFSDRKGIYKLFWIILFVLGVIAFAANLYFLVKMYVKRPVLTQLDRTSKHFEWPHLTFCNPSNPIPFWKSKSLEKSWNETYLKAHNYSLPKYGIGNHERKIWEHYIALSSVNPAEMYAFRETGLVMTVKVVYRQSSVAVSSNLFDKYHTMEKTATFFQSLMASFRAPTPCFTLMPEEISKQIKGDHRLLAIKLYLLVDFRSHRIYNYGYESRKLYFYVTNPYTTLQHSFPHYILSGTDSFFVLKHKTHERVPECREKEFQVELFDAAMNISHHYIGNYEDCRMFVSQRNFIKKCKCANPHLPVYRFTKIQPPLCTNMSVYNSSAMRANIECLNQVMAQDLKTNVISLEIETECKKYQQSACKSTIYEVTRHTNAWQTSMNDERRRSTSHSKLPNMGKDVVDKAKFVRENLIIMNIVSSKDGREDTQEEFEYPLSQFMSDFGGAVGLWIGLSVISFFEIMELIIVFIQYIKK